MNSRKIISGDTVVKFRVPGVIGDTPVETDIPRLAWKPAFRVRVGTCKRELLLGHPEKTLLERHGAVVLRNAKNSMSV